MIYSINERKMFNREAFGDHFWHNEIIVIKSIFKDLISKFHLPTHDFLIHYNEKYNIIFHVSLLFTHVKYNFTLSY